MRQDGTDLAKDEFQEEWELIDGRKRTSVERIRRSVRETFLAQAERVEKAFEKKELIRQEEILTADSVFDVAEAVSETLDATEGDVRQVLREGFVTGNLRVEGEASFDADAPWVRQEMARLNRQMRRVPVNTQGVINSIIERGRQEGKSIDEIADDITTRLRRMASGQGGPEQPGSINRSRARRVAETTTTTAFEAGQDRAWEDAGIWGGWWLSQRDGFVSRGHFEADGQVRARGELYMVRRTLDKPKEQIRYPGDPQARASNIVNCRCSRMPLLTEPEDDE